MDWIASVLLWIGNIILIKKKSWVCFVFYFLANVLWSIYWFSKQEWAALILVGTFILQNIWGMISWRREEKDGNKE